MELIQYSPTTRTAYETPILCSPPWINKYYVMDLAPGRSFIQWAVDHGHTVFAISYRNPDQTMRGVKLDDYLLQGPVTALDVVRDITGAPQANVVGLCLGGTLTTMLIAYLDAIGDQRVKSATLLNTLIDFSSPGVLGTFTDPDTVERLEAKMARQGYLEGREMATTFDLLRANDLIWNYVASNWLMGEDPPAFDILAWNADSTRMPAAMHSFYLRTCYLENQLARGEMELAGVRLNLDDGRPRTCTWSAPVTTTSPPGRPRTAPPSWSRATPGSCSARRATSPASSTRPAPRRAHWTNDDDPARPRRLAGRRHRAPGLVVGGLGRLGQGPRRPAPQAPAHGQRQVPGDRRRPRFLRPREVGPRGYAEGRTAPVALALVRLAVYLVLTRRARRSPRCPGRRRCTS